MSEGQREPPLFDPIIERLERAHDLSHFRCGKAALDGWLQRFALINQQNDSARTYVLKNQGIVLGYYSIAAGAVRKADSPERFAKGLANHPVGVVLLARLAVGGSCQGQGIGKLLLRDALSRAIDAAEIIGARGILVHAMDDEAARFYANLGFVSSPLDSRQLLLPLKDIRSTLGLPGSKK
jgi:GNAT superfamily N-acetyltransferase